MLMIAKSSHRINLSRLQLIQASIFDLRTRLWQTPYMMITYHAQHDDHTTHMFSRIGVHKGLKKMLHNCDDGDDDKSVVSVFVHSWLARRLLWHTMSCWEVDHCHQDDHHWYQNLVTIIIGMMKVGRRVSSKVPMQKWSFLPPYYRSVYFNCYLFDLLLLLSFVWFVIVIVICLIVGTMSPVSTNTTTVHITVICTTMITEYHHKYCPQSMSQYSEALRV